MRNVNIAELKARLSAHIRRVRASEEVLVCDRNRPVARIVPFHLEGYSEQEQRLIARGVLTLRADDALQLAAAFEWCAGVPRGWKFLTADTQLFQAALLCGFDALNI